MVDLVEDVARAADMMMHAFDDFYRAYRDDSTVSESVYVEFHDDDDEAVWSCRLSDHQLPPTYELDRTGVWLDAWVTVPRPGAHHWTSVVQHIGGRLDGWSPNACLELEFAKHSVWVRMVGEQRERDAQQQELAVQRRVENQQLLEAHGAGHLTGLARKRMLRKLRDRS